MFDDVEENTGEIDKKEKIQTKEKTPSSQKILGMRFQSNFESEENPEKKKKHTHFSSSFKIAKTFFTLSLFVPVCTWLFFEAQLEPGNGLAHIFSSQNYGQHLQEIQNKQEEKKQEVKEIKKEIYEMKREIINIRENSIIQEIKKNRIDFLGVMLKINKITLDSLQLTEELNDAIRMLVFKNYSGKNEGEKTKISISGTVRDPQKKSLSKLTKLMEVINDDEQFHGAGVRSFSKTDQNNTGSQSEFQFSFFYTPDSFLQEKNMSDTAQ